MQYDAFGETLTRSGSTATPVQFAGTSGYQADAATGLLLLGHRYYDPSIGRFLSSDPAQAGSNWYAYCDNNPLVRVDPTGFRPWWHDVVAIGGFVSDYTIGKAVIRMYYHWKIVKIDMDGTDATDRMWHRYSKNHPHGYTKLWPIWNQQIRQDLKDIGHATGDTGQFLYGHATFGSTGY